MHDGYCAPRIVDIAKKLKESSPTIHYNIKQMEKNKVIKAYKAVFDYSKIDEGMCNYILININSDEYGNPERIGRELAELKQVESVDIISGGWEILIKIRTKDVGEFYQFVKNVLSKNGIAKTTSLTSLKQLKTEFVNL
ncbi:MAG: Lrp/AsnC family transcriptional regulator [Candidatus Micrarchaeia archaeon]